MKQFTSNQKSERYMAFIVIRHRTPEQAKNELKALGFTIWKFGSQKLFHWALASNDKFVKFPAGIFITDPGDVLKVETYKCENGVTKKIGTHPATLADLLR